MGGKLRFLVVLGTRPEAIKLAPVIRELRQYNHIKTIVCATGQHKSLFEQGIKNFGITPDYNLNVMKEAQTLADLTERITRRLDILLERLRPDIVIIQGDTTTAFLSALCAYHRKISVAHVEAGLRTHDAYNPFPEEINRALISRISRFNFAPTELAVKNLLKEGVDAKTIFRTGNTIVDALNIIKPELAEGALETWFKGLGIAPGKFILFTCHRRESFGRDQASIFSAIRRIAGTNAGLKIVYPVHKNPNVLNTARREFKRCSNVVLIEPVEYRKLLLLLQRCLFVITDSGGIIEEAPSFRKFVIIVRKKTERTESVKSGIAFLAGVRPAAIARLASKIISGKVDYTRFRKNPFGDGRAAGRIAKILSMKLRQAD